MVTGVSSVDVSGTTESDQIQADTIASLLEKQEKKTEIIFDCLGNL
jgi:ribonuclease PH